MEVPSLLVFKYFFKITFICLFVSVYTFGAWKKLALSFYHAGLGD